MRIYFILTFFLLYFNFSFAQTINPIDTLKALPIDTIKPDEGHPKQQLEEIKKAKVVLLSDSAGGNEPKKSTLVDTTVTNKYGDLLDDDTTANRKAAFWKPALGVLGLNAFIQTADRFFFKYDYATSVNLNSWKYNLKTGWAWDNDRFGINFSGHPFTGALYLNIAHSSGYNYFQSFPFAVEGSLMWEYFGENTLPSYTDIVNTTVNGAFLGEVLYRVSSNILDDRTRGFERTYREIFAGIIDPVRGVERLFQGKTFRKTNKEVYQKEPLNISFFTGIDTRNYTNKTLSTLNTQNVIADLQLDYGNPFEVRKRKAFDFFKVRLEVTYGAGRKILDNVLGYGILFGKNAQMGKLSMLIGAFQSYDYWDSYSFELMAIGFGGGIFTKYPLGKKSFLYTDINISGIPLGANSGRNGPDTSQFRDYAYDNGIEGKIESSLILDNYLTVSLLYYYYFMHTYTDLVTKDYGLTASDVPGINNIGILKPNITLHLFKGLSLGYEHYIYYNNRHNPDLPPINNVRTENKLYLLYYFEDAQRKGHYQ